MRETKKVVLIIAFALTTTHQGRTQTQISPATFSGLRIGKATIADFQKVFGKPMDLYQDNSGTTYLQYRNIGPVTGVVEVQADTKSNIIGVISIDPDNL